MEDILFPARKSKIKEIKHSNFPTDSGTTMYGVNLEMENGDLFSTYNPSDGFFKLLKVGTKIEYELLKSGGKTKAKTIKMVSKTKKKPLISDLDGTHIEDLLFIDIETVRITDGITKTMPLYESWAYKRRNEANETTPTDLKASYKDKAPLYAEFGKIVCISVGMIKRNGEVFIQSYYGDLEKDILIQFRDVLKKFRSRFPRLRLCGHAIIGFDIPFIAKRMIVNGIRVPDFLNTFDVKPWELGDRFIDTNKLWKGTAFYGASLLNVAEALSILSPKQDLDGSKVSDAYYNGGLEDVVRYCELDVFTVVNIMQHLYNTERSGDYTSKTFEK